MPTTRPRRSRYTVTYADGTRQVYLGYSAATIREWRERSGDTGIVRIESGDYRKDEHQRKLVQEQHAMGGSGFRLNQAAIEEAKRMLGLTMPVEVVLTSPIGGQRGCYYFRPLIGAFKKDPRFDTAIGGMKHYITLKAWLSPEQASRTLWHELAHAMQAERECVAASARTEREMYDAWKYAEVHDRGVAYEDKSVEVEAREHSAYHDALPLTTPR